ncbi:hypothetical protein OUZ56_005762 [Daphnia magna]|uniref:Uncharacterized protein n=1 Tax=Daphnia magna TaxID=35525 RepID=A0ABQ9YTP4_9CRUS|nr:hypothetical protein OUZ56_005762 [Daphnia magna]
MDDLRSVKSAQKIKITYPIAIKAIRSLWGRALPVAFSGFLGFARVMEPWLVHAERNPYTAFVGVVCSVRFPYRCCDWLLKFSNTFPDWCIHHPSAGGSDCYFLN